MAEQYAETVASLKLENFDLRNSLHDLLDLLERGDGFQQKERMRTAGRLLGLQRYDGTEPNKCAESRQFDGTVS